MRARAILVLLLSWTGTAQAQLRPNGTEFRVNSTTLGSQERPDVAMDDTGGFTVVWQSDQLPWPDVLDIFGQRYDAAGSPFAGEFQVNAVVSDYQTDPAVAVAGAGGFVVAWADLQVSDFGGDVATVAARPHDAAGTPLGAEFPVSAEEGVYRAAVSVDGAGNFVVGWDNAVNFRPSTVVARRFDAAGTPLGAAFPVSEDAANTDVAAAVDLDDAGNLVVAWVKTEACIGCLPPPRGLGVWARRYDAAGTPAGGAFEVSPWGSQATVASDEAGRFVVAWSEWEAGGRGLDIFARRYDSTGLPLGGAFRVNTHVDGYQSSADVASDDMGNFIVVWCSFDQDGEGWGVFARPYDQSGLPQGDEFQVNTHVASDQESPRVALADSGDAVIVWTSEGQDGSEAGVYAQRFSVNPAALLRNDEVMSLRPLSPPLASILPLAPGPPPGGDRYLDPFASGGEDPAPSSSPLVFYALDGPGVLRLVKTSDSLRIVY